MKKSNNQGFTLVELLVSVAILAILMTGVWGMITAASKYFADSQREVEIQDQLQTCFVQISNMIVDSNPDIGIMYGEASGKAYLYACHDDRVSFVVKDGNKVYAEEKTYPATITTAEDKAKYAAEQITNNAVTMNVNTCLTERCTTFKVDTSTAGNGYVVLAIRLTYAGRTAYLCQNVFLRNSAGATSIVGNLKTSGSVTPKASPTPDTSTETGEESTTVTPVPTAEVTKEPTAVPTIHGISIPSPTPTPDTSGGSEGTVTLTVNPTYNGGNYYIDLNGYMDATIVSVSFEAGGDSWNGGHCFVIGQSVGSWNDKIVEGAKINTSYTVNAKISYPILWFQGGGVISDAKTFTVVVQGK